MGSPYNGTAVGSPTYTSTGVPSAFGQALVLNGSSQYVDLSSNPPPIALASGSPFTVRCRFLTTSAATQVMVGTCYANASPPFANFWFIGMASGKMLWSYGSGVGTVAGTTLVNDGAWHTAEISYDGTKAYLLLDGVLQNPGGTPTTFTAPGSPKTFIGALQVASVTDYFAGKIDEVVFCTTCLHTASYTVETTPFLGGTPGVQALYPLDGTVTDTAAVVDPSNPALLYSPYTWSVQAGSAQTINAGAYLRTLFSGTSCQLAFTTTNLVAPLPQIWIRVDGGPVQQATVAATVTVTVPATSPPWHLLEIIVKSTTFTQNRWNSPSSAAVILTALTLAGNGAVLAPTARTKHVLVYGDSITEGEYVNGTAYANDTDNSDILQSYAWALGPALDAEIGIVAFGGQGVVTAGAENVPSLENAYALLSQGVARTFTPTPDLVIYNQGTNDTSTSGAPWQSALETVIGGIGYSATKHLILVPFQNVSSHAADIGAVVTALNSPQVTSYDASGLITSTDCGNGPHPWGYAHLGKIAPPVAAASAAVLYPPGTPLPQPLAGLISASGNVLAGAL